VRREGAAATHCNTWGDGLFVVFADPVRAADCAARVMAALAEVDPADLGLPGDLALRLGGHYGPCFERDDPLRGGPNCFGAAVTRAARIEPVAPPGAFYVTEEFAAALAMGDPAPPLLSYVGRVPLAKNAGATPLYRCAPRSGPGAAP
jgi:Adenylate cyclase, family 3 (some proteins contain HAMP domain)